MADRLKITGLTYKGYHGVFDEEKRNGNTFEVDLTFITDLGTSGSSDQLSDTLDYVEAERIIAAVMGGESVNLIETLTLRIGDKLYDKFSYCDSISVSIRKMNPPVQGTPRSSEVTMTWPR